MTERVLCPALSFRKGHYKSQRYVLYVVWEFTTTSNWLRNSHVVFSSWQVCHLKDVGGKYQTHPNCNAIVMKKQFPRKDFKYST